MFLQYLKNRKSTSTFHLDIKDFMAKYMTKVIYLHVIKNFVYRKRVSEQTIIFENL